MNLVLKNVFSASTGFYPAQDVYGGFNLLKQIPAINLIIIDLDENCSDCLDFILFITSSKVYKREIVILLSSSNIEKVSKIKEIESVKIYTKPFSPIRLKLDALECINTGT